MFPQRKRISDFGLPARQPPYPEPEIQNLESKIQNPKMPLDRRSLAALVAAASLLITGCSSTRSSKPPGLLGKPATSSKSDNNTSGTSQKDTIPNAAAVGL
jgi:hypothetical protein